MTFVDDSAGFPVSDDLIVLILIAIYPSGSVAPLTRAVFEALAALKLLKGAPLAKTTLLQGAVFMTIAGVGSEDTNNRPLPGTLAAQGWTGGIPELHESDALSTARAS